MRSFSESGVVERAADTASTLEGVLAASVPSVGSFEDGGTFCGWFEGWFKGVGGIFCGMEGFCRVEEKFEGGGFRGGPLVAKARTVSRGSRNDLRAAGSMMAFMVLSVFWFY